MGSLALPTTAKSSSEPPQELLEFVARNTWFSTDNKTGPGKDLGMTKMAIALACQIREEHPAVSLAQCLELVEEELRVMYPTKFTSLTEGGPH